MVVVVVVVVDWLMIGPPSLQKVEVPYLGGRLVVVLKYPDSTT